MAEHFLTNECCMRSSRSIDQAQVSERQLRTLFRIAISAFGGFGHELFHTLCAIRALTAAVTKHAADVDHAKHLTDWIAHVPPILDRAESMIRMGMEYRRYGWSGGDPFITRPVQLLDDIRKCFPDATICVGERSAQSLELIFPDPALFTIFHELIANAIKHSAKPAQVRIAWHVRFEKFICEIDDNGPGICDKLSMTYLDRWTLGVDPRAGLFTVEETMRASSGRLLFRRSADLGGTQVKIELPLVGYWFDDELCMWRTVFETDYDAPQ